MPHDADADLLGDLTPEQLEAVTHFEGPLLILAAAGSGKTRVITRRVAHLIRQGVRPSNILAITFTNKAAGEMRQRIDALVPNNHVWVSTFHSLGARLVRQYADRFGLGRNFTIYDPTDRKRLIETALKVSNIDHTRFPPERIENAISRAKNQLLAPEQYASKANDFFSMTVAAVYPIYERKLREANALDFDDLLLWPALALKHDQELRAELDGRFRFVLIDEYQDTNLAQYAIARGLSVDHPNLCVVGDPDQSIYKWRGSDIRNILDFERDFPSARVITLGRNYRSTKRILQAAGHLIAHNRQRKPKELVTENPTGNPVTILTYESGIEEAEGVVSRIRQAVTGQGRPYRDFAIFLRMNALSRALETAFLKARVPFQIVKGLAFFERKENRDVLAYLRLLLNPRDNLSFLRSVNEPPRGIGKVSLEHLQAYAEPRGLSLFEAAAHVENIPAIRGKAAKSISDFRQLMLELESRIESAPDEIIREVIDRSGYREMLLASSDREDQDRLANIEELITAARQFAAEDSSRTLADFLENITLASDVDGWDEQQDCVSIMTLHSAKGLEFPVVYIMATEQGILPHERSLAKDEDVEEERRLAFVGMTRAKEELYLTHARVREFRGQSLYALTSMFLDELPADAIEQVDLSSSGSTRAFDNWRSNSGASRTAWEETGISAKKYETPLNDDGNPDAQRLTEGTLVMHDKYGAGQVTHVSGYGALRKVKVRFAAAGERTFMAERAKFAIVESEC
jgi:DNA helicase-2/ATP-dependent DNA helicase PcrA